MLFLQVTKFTIGTVGGTKQLSRTLKLVEGDQAISWSSESSKKKEGDKLFHVSAVESVGRGSGKSKVMQSVRDVDETKVITITANEQGSKPYALNLQLSTAEEANELFIGLVLLLRQEL